MPRIADLHLPPSPRDDPLSYPGRTLDYSYLWLDGWIHPLAPSPGRRLADWGTTIDGGPAGERRHSGLAGLLEAIGVPGLDARFPVLAFGSNAAPAQLLDKFGSVGASERAIPVTRGTVRGFALSHSPHVSNPGYVPYVVVDSSHSALPVSVLWLDESQLQLMNRTEPNYRLVQAPAGRYRLDLESGELVAAYNLYRGNWGALHFPGESGPAAAGGQPEIFARLSSLTWFRALTGSGGTEAQQTRLRSDRNLRDRVREELTLRSMVVPDGWAVLD